MLETQGQAPIGHRARRTREQLQQAALELLAEKGYDAIGIQDITDRAHVGRTTFYLHFKSKEELIMRAHVDSVARLGWSITAESLIARDPPEHLVRFTTSVAQSRSLYLDVGRSEDALLLFRLMRNYAAEAIENCLRANFDEQSCKMPFTILANYLAGAQISLVTWWIENRLPCSPQQLAESYQTLQRAAIQDALRISEPADCADIRHPSDNSKM